MIFNELKKLWLDYHRQNVGKKTNQYAAYLLNKHFSVFNNSDIGSIKPFDIYQIVSVIQSKREAKKSVALLSNVFTYGRIMGLAEHNPATGITKYLGTHIEKPRATILNHLAIGAMLRDIDLISNQTIRNAIKMIVFTAQRRTEVIGARWDEFDLKNKLWTIPTSRMKMRNAHVVPITGEVEKILRQQKNKTEYVFPSKLKNKHIHPGIVLVALHDLGYKGKQTLHGFRATFSTFANDSQKFGVDVIEAQLAHQIRGVRGAYNRGTYFTERVTMMEWYEALLKELKSHRSESSSLFLRPNPTQK